MTYVTEHYEVEQDEAEYYSDDGRDDDYTWSDSATEDECAEEEQDKDSATDLDSGVLQIRAGKKGC